MPTRILTLILLPLILLALVACSSDVPEGIFQCDVDDDCPDDHVCETEARRCYSRGFDTSVCGPGFHARGGECIDNDECERADRCGVGGTCTNEEGAFDCACNETSEPTYPGPGCRDVDECRYGADRCSAYATCTDVVGSFSCTCETGFQGDGIDCDRTCNLSAEPDIGSRSFAITHFGIADSGFELDGLDSSDTGTAVQPYECRAWPDMTGGLDNELDRIGSYDEMPLHTGLKLRSPRGRSRSRSISTSSRPGRGRTIPASASRSRPTSARTVASARSSTTSSRASSLNRSNSMFRSGHPTPTAPGRASRPISACASKQHGFACCSTRPAPRSCRARCSAASISSSRSSIRGPPGITSTETDSTRGCGPGPMRSDRTSTPASTTTANR
ncbi:MAG: hypothetical protein IPG17_29495 [Sandaracinaceae bacterium]|nr:hypothetical protein [Sandaracinaceae bacterium]